MRKRTFINILCGMAACVCISCSNDDVEQDTSNVGENNTLVVDLGLSVKWAVCNLGAESPEQIGDYYAWGETSVKNEYSDTNYFDENYSIFTLSDRRKISGTEQDAAYVQLGKDWRIPTTEEMDELVNGCTWTEETLNGVNGMRGKAPNGNSIFLPITGMFAGNKVQSTSQGCYWSGDLFTDNANSNKYASILTFFKGEDVHISNYYRFEGMAIRPVFVGTENEDSNKPTVEDPVTPPTDDIEDNLPTEAKMFVGYWSNSGSSREYCPDLYLSADGTCFAIYEKQDKKWDWDYTWYTHIDQGYWSYDNSTKMFATSINWQFTVTLSNEWAWAGIYEKGSKTYNQSLQKESNVNLAQFLINKVDGWMSSDNISVNLKGYSISEDDNSNDFTFNYQKGTEKGTVTINNPFYLSKISLIFTGTINETFYRDWK